VSSYLAEASRLTPLDGTPLTARARTTSDPGPQRPDQVATRDLGSTSEPGGGRGQGATEMVATVRKRTPLVNQGGALRPLNPASPLSPSASEASKYAKDLLKRSVWAREELNLRPLPCQQNTGNRCARRRSPRSPPTVDPEGKRSLGVQLNALFAHLYVLPSPGGDLVDAGD
jgi:hypothetical protein